MTDERSTRGRGLLTAVLMSVAAAGAFDLAQDSPQTLTPLHIFAEGALLVLALGSIGYMWLGWMRERRRAGSVRAALETHRADRDAWRSRAENLLRGLGDEIDRQLRTWGLTPAERDTALLVLKGYSHREIGALLSKSERTVRQQAGGVYRKSGLAGRAELSAFFLEDLLLPAPGAAESPTPG